MRPIGTHNYYVYILTNLRKAVLYTGVTDDLGKRVYEHRHSEKSFTARYQCFYLVYYERFQYIEHAIAREKEIKGWTRKKKDKLISDFNPEWRFLDPERD
ncbi:MAG: putative endonuclease containing a domain [Bacteroidetes bacterium]|nr:putative endonuclease containing a domain [Bacteroidota bacterium]